MQRSCRPRSTPSCPSCLESPDNLVEERRSKAGPCIPAHTCWAVEGDIANGYILSCFLQLPAPSAGTKKAWRSVIPGSARPLGICADCSQAASPPGPSAYKNALHPSTHLTSPRDARNWNHRSPLVTRTFPSSVKLHDLQLEGAQSLGSELESSSLLMSC